MIKRIPILHLFERTEQFESKIAAEGGQYELGGTVV